MMQSIQSIIRNRTHFLMYVKTGDIKYLIAIK